MYVCVRPLHVRVILEEIGPGQGPQVQSQVRIPGILNLLRLLCGEILASSGLECADHIEGSETDPAPLPAPGERQH